MKTKIAQTPVLGASTARVGRWVRGMTYPGSAAFWERTYARGGTSGHGSYGALAEFKARVMNEFLAKHTVTSAIEFGCGDGNQLTLMAYPSYIGLDVTKAAIQRCKRRFSDDLTKSFFFYDPECFVDNHSIFSADLAISLDVIFHLTEEETYQRYMRNLFSSAQRLVAIYSSDTQDSSTVRVACVRHHNFSAWVKENASEWELIEQVSNPLKYPEVPDGSFADFYFYRRNEL